MLVLFKNYDAYKSCAKDTKNSNKFRQTLKNAVKMSDFKLEMPQDINM